MKRPAVFFDRDNTLIASDGYLGDPAKVRLVPGAAEAVARARRLGYAVVVISNQSGVARGMFSEEDVQAVNTRMEQMLAAENPQAVIDRHEFCPFHPEGSVDVYARDSDRRKPRPGMIHAAAKALALDVERSWVIGDAGRDVEAGKAAGCRTILFVDPELKKSPAAEAPSSVEPDYTVATLGEALDYIERERGQATAEAAPVVATAAPAAAAPVMGLRRETPASAPSAAPANGAAAEQEKPSAESATAVAAPVSEAATGKRVPKVAIGSKYVPPEGKEAPRAMFVPPPREEVAEAPAARKTAIRATVDEESERPADPPATPNERIESLLEQIFLELRRQHEHHDADFSVSKLLAGVVQVLVLGVMLMAYFKRPDWVGVQILLLLASVLQTLTISLLIMTRQK